MRNSRWRTSSLLALIGTIVFLLATAFLRSAANITVQNQFRSEGRPITPAGTLVMDSTRRQPAVGALPVAFVRSPDKTGPEGLGRYPNTSVEAPFIDIDGFATSASSPRYNSDHAPVYPTGLALSPDGDRST